MYSAVLMLALTAGSEAADFGKNRCNGCSASCTTTVVKACSNGARVSCTSSCHGRHRLFGNRCHGASACTKAVVVPATSCASTRVRSHGCGGSCSGGGLFGRLFHRNKGCTATCATVVIEKKSEAVKPPMNDGEVRFSAPAKVLVSLPADARLIVDGSEVAPTRQDRRTLVTPNLAVGSTYVYTMRAEVVRDGQTVVQTQEVRVRGGQTSAVEFNFGTNSFASR